jgi:TolB-like protein
VVKSGLILYHVLSLNYQREEYSGLETSIAVLPFENMSIDEEYDYIGGAFTDEIIMELQKIKAFDRVLSRTSTMQYEKERPTIPEIADKLNVNYIIEGSIQRYKEDVKIRVQVIRAQDEDHIWADEYLGKWIDIFSIQDEIAYNVANKLSVALSTEELMSISKRPTENLAAYSLLLKARSTDGMERLNLLDEALALDPNFAAAYAEKGGWWLWYAGGWRGSVGSSDVISNALPLLTRALGIDPNNAEAHYGLAGLQIWYFWNFAASEEEYKLAIQLNPSNAEVIHDYTDLLDAAGRFDEALEWSNKGVEADPTTIWERGLRQYFANQHDEALETFKLSIGPSETDPNRYTEEARVLLYLGHYQAVTDIIHHFLERYPNDTSPRQMGTLAIANYKLGQKELAIKLLEEIKARSQQSAAGSPAFYVAMIYSQMGEINLAFDWLQKAYEDKEVEMYWLKVEPPFEPIRGDPRFQDLLNQMNFPD